jgi:hypothetical protein
VRSADGIEAEAQGAGHEESGGAARYEVDAASRGGSADTVAVRWRDRSRALSE